MQFKPNFDLIRMWGDITEIPVKGKPFVAMFKRENKTLVYMGDVHSYNESFDMVDMCFSDGFGIKPDVLLTEMVNDGYEHKFGPHGIQANTLAYATVIAEKHSVPVVFADLSDRQSIHVLQSLRPAKKIDIDFLHNLLVKTVPNVKGNELEKLHAEFDKYGRDTFMIQNIAAALNKYNTVFCIFGRGHYAQQQLVLEDMLGKPEYITKIKNMRGDFSDIKIEPIKLCDFEIKNNIKQINNIGMIVNDKNNTGR